jgi:tRNA-dihydrouridine synthase
MAPMVAMSDYPYRLLLRRYGDVDLVYTQMLHAKNFVRDRVFRRNHLDLYEAGLQYHNEPYSKAQLDCLGLTDIPRQQQQYIHRPVVKDDAPVMVQLAGHDVASVVQAAQMLYEHTDGRLTGIDLNCGCPQQIARKGRYGAFLMEADSHLVCEILAALRRHLPESVAISCKMRLPIDDETLLGDRIPRLLDTGIDFLTIHGRTLWENKTKVGACHVDRIKASVEAANKIRPGFPIIANGGMENYDDVQRILQTTGAVAAMSSEGLLEKPDLFSDRSTSSPDKESADLYRSIFRQQFLFARNYLNICEEVGPPLPFALGANKGGSISVVRGHLYKFLHRYLNEQHDIRDALSQGFHHEDSIRNLNRAHKWLDRLEERYLVLGDDDEAWMAMESSSLDSSWYRRHRKPDRRVHQRDIQGLASSTSSVVDQPQTPEERKAAIKSRIAKLKGRREMKSGKSLANVSM